MSKPSAPSATVLPFPYERRLRNLQTHVPSLWQMVRLLQIARNRAPKEFSLFDHAILIRAMRVAHQTEDEGPSARTFEYMRYCRALLAKHCVYLTVIPRIEPEAAPYVRN